MSCSELGLVALKLVSELVAGARHGRRAPCPARRPVRLVSKPGWVRAAREVVADVDCDALAGVEAAADAEVRVQPGDVSLGVGVRRWRRAEAREAERVLGGGREALAQQDAGEGVAATRWGVRDGRVAGDRGAHRVTERGVV